MASPRGPRPEHHPGDLREAPWFSRSSLDPGAAAERTGAPFCFSSLRPSIKLLLCKSPPQSALRDGATLQTAPQPCPGSLLLEPQTSAFMSECDQAGHRAPTERSSPRQVVALSCPGSDTSLLSCSHSGSPPKTRKRITRTPGIYVSPAAIIPALTWVFLLPTPPPHTGALSILLSPASPTLP